MSVPLRSFQDSLFQIGKDEFSLKHSIQYKGLEKPVSLSLSSSRMKESALSVLKSPRLCHRITDDTAIEPGGFPSTTAYPLDETTRRHSEDSGQESALPGTLGLIRCVGPLRPGVSLIAWALGPLLCVAHRALVIVLCPLCGLLVYACGPFSLCLQALLFYAYEPFSLTPTGPPFSTVFMCCIVCLAHDMLSFAIPNYSLSFGAIQIPSFPDSFFYR